MNLTAEEIYVQNPMRQIRLEKVSVHIGVGKSGDELERAKKVLESITGQKPTTRRAKRTVKDFGIRKGEPISCLVTLRKDRATSFLKRALTAVGNRIKETSFDKTGNFALGIREHIEIPGTKYVPELGIFGMDVIVALERPGYRVKRRRIRTAPVGKFHTITREEAIKFVKDSFGVEIAETEA